MNFAEYLVSKKIDEVLFKEKENALWIIWRQEFETMHPNSFTAQKLYLINPIRRKYPLKIDVVNPAGAISNPVSETVVSKPAKPAMAKPSMPKPAISKPVVLIPKSEDDSEKSTSSSQPEPPKEQPPAKPVMAKPAIPRPVIKPKPKTDS